VSVCVFETFTTADYTFRSSEDAGYVSTSCFFVRILRAVLYVLPCSHSFSARKWKDEDLVKVSYTVPHVNDSNRP
jgi:hypothetical protein